LLDTVELKNAMNKFWANGGYLYTTLRDQTYYREIDRHIAEFVGPTEGRRILDLACGKRRLPAKLNATNRIVAVDLAEVAVRKAKQNHPDVGYAVMDAHHLGFPDSTFDTVLFIDAIEHVADAGSVLSEITRVLVPNGHMIVTVANRNSLHEVFSRKLGFPEFKTNYQHIREFTYQEMDTLLHDRRFSIAAAKGIFLYPYWGIPMYDDAVRRVTDEDPDTVELFRMLGERVGPEHAYAFTIHAIKR
jgi:SAM-dependent methyltransferase